MSAAATGPLTNAPCPARPLPAVIEELLPQGEPRQSRALRDVPPDRGQETPSTVTRTSTRSGRCRPPCWSGSTICTRRVHER